MKKILLVLAFAGVSVAGMAQEKKFSVETNSFWSNWFVQANVGFDAFYSNQEKGLGFSKSPFKSFRSNVSPSVAIGKWFTPGLGLRTKATGIWGRSVGSEDASTNAMKFLNLQEQVMFNLSNMFCGYNPNRVWNFIPYAGVGVIRNFDANENGHAGSLGILNTWKLSRRLALNLDVNFNISDDDLEGEVQGHDRYFTSIPTADRYFAAELGLTLNLGKTGWTKSPDVDAIRAAYEGQIDGLNNMLDNANGEIARLNDVIKNHKCPEAKTVTVKEVTAAPVSVFFNIGSAKVASKKDLVNLQGLADAAKANNKTLVVTGSADSKTGSAAYNQKLSEKRAETVKAELVKMGVAESQIEVKAIGGVDNINPFSYNRRAVVEVK
jgi:outer membrane protein OmpA-like peptidoglycan-associated protein